MKQVAEINESWNICNTSVEELSRELINKLENLWVL